MSEFNITREMVQELAETGAVQLRGLDLGVGYGNKSVRGDLSMGRFAPSELPGCLDEIAEICVEVANIANEQAVAFKTSLLPGRMGPRKNPREMGEKDFHIDGNCYARGFTVLDSTKGIKREKLVTAGRHLVADTGSIRSFSYAKGPIIIAQYRFGSNLLCVDQAFGETWHEGLRSSEGEVLVIDVKTSVDS